MSIGSKISNKLNREAVARWRARNPSANAAQNKAAAAKHRTTNPQKIKARNAVNNSGGVSGKRCASCGKPATEGHHTGYGPTAKVTPYCTNCHPGRGTKT